MSHSYYTVLDISTKATDKEIEEGYTKIKNAYTDEAAMYTIASPDECQRMLQQAEEAHSILIDPAKRKQYDQAHGINDKQTDKKTDITEAKNKTNQANRYHLNFKINNDFEEEITNQVVFDGTFLRKIREYKNVSIEQLAQLTRLSKTNIKNIEEESFERIPADVYLRSFVYQYAKTLRLDPDRVANSYVTNFKNLV